MNKFTFCIFLLLSGVAQADLLGLSNPADMAGKQGWGVHASAHYLTGTDFTAAKNFNGNWDGPYSPRNDNNLAMLIARIETGVTYDSWRISGIYRKETLIETNRDTTDIVYYNKQHLAVPAGRTFITNARIEGFEARGMRLDKGFGLTGNEDGGLSLGVGISLLQGTRVRIAKADGIAASTVAGYTYNATLEDSNDRATYPFIRNATPDGNGYALDVGAKIFWAIGACLDLAVNDLFGKMTWRNMPHTIETANSQTLARDAAGYIYYNPTVSGTNDLNRRTIEQRLTPKAQTRFTYPVSDFDLFAGTGWIKGYWFPELGASYRINNDWKTSLDYDTRFNSVGFGIQHKLGRLSARSTSANLGSAKAYGFNAEIRIPF